jgi:hypothetical protein
LSIKLPYPQVINLVLAAEPRPIFLRSPRLSTKEHLLAYNTVTSTCTNVPWHTSYGQKDLIEL